MEEWPLWSCLVVWVENIGNVNVVAAPWGEGGWFVYVGGMW